MKYNAVFLKQAFISGSNSLYNYYPKIDKLNVFPVPDGDTGTNMNLTVSNGIKEIENIENDSLQTIANSFARGLIMGARGNSGVILSQIFKGFSLGLEGIKELTVEILKKCFINATSVAYNAVMKPVEGTILTIIREIAEKFEKFDVNSSIIEAFKAIIKIANISLENTPQLLPILKEVGVVDSGAYGLVKFFEGMYVYIEKGKIVKRNLKKHSEENNNSKIIMNIKNEEFGYCTESIIMLNNNYIYQIDINKLKNNLTDQGGQSIVAVIDNDIIKVHVHTLIPGQVLTYLQQFGEFKNIKVDNMTLQAGKHLKNIKSERKLKNKYAIIAVTPSKAIGKYFKEELNVNLTIDGGQSMNPSTNDYLLAIEAVDAEHVFLLPNNSNTLLAAQEAAKLEVKSHVNVIPTSSIAEGMVAAISYDHSETSKKNVTILKSSFKNTISIAISKSIKNVIIDGININNNDYMGIVNKKIIVANNNIKVVLKTVLNKTISKSTEIVTIFTGQDAENNDIKDIIKFFDENFDIEYEIIDGEQTLYPYIMAVE